MYIMYALKPRFAGDALVTGAQAASGGVAALAAVTSGDEGQQRRPRIQPADGRPLLLKEQNGGKKKWRKNQNKITK